MITTGEFHSCPINDIIVNREVRLRKSIGDVTELAESIKDRGLVHPIVITRNYVLVAGERRLTACKLLGWDQIVFQFVDEVDLNELEAQEELELIELHENIQRQDLTWKEVNDSYTRIYEIAKRRNPNLTLDQASKVVGLSHKSDMAAHLLVKRERAHNSRVNESATFTNAKNVARAVTERRAADEAESILGGFNPPCSPILNTDFTVWAESYSGPKFNFIHCDFPYGIDADASGINPAGYDDSLDTFLKLFKTLAVFLDNFCAPSAHMIFWYSPKHHFITWENLKLLDGFQFDEVPLVWHKADGRGIAPDQQRRPRRIYETAFFGWRGDRKIVKLKDNLFSAPTERQRHPHEKSELALRHFFELCVGPTTRLLDPTVGSGSSLRAALTLGAESVLGIELNEEYADAARRSLSGLGSGVERDEDISDALVGQ